MQFGGISIYDSIGKKVKEQYSLCNKHFSDNELEWVVSRSLFSHTSTCLLVIYIHKEYSSLYTVLEMSYSHCKTVTLQNKCEKVMNSMARSSLFKACSSREEPYTFGQGKYTKRQFLSTQSKSVVLLQHNACTIIQFSSGIYKVFHEKDADKEAAKSLASWFPAKCFLDVQLTTSGKKSFTASHNITIFGDYFPSASIEMKVGKIDSEFASGSYTLAEISKVNSAKERKIRTLRYLFECISYHWKTKTFLAKLNLNLQGPFTFQTSFHAWSGT